MDEQEADFQRAYQSSVTEITRMYATALTVMQIELGSEAARELAPRYLGDIVAAGERLALGRLELQRTATGAAPDAEMLVLGESEAAARRRVQLTIDDALGGSEPW